MNSTSGKPNEPAEVRGRPNRLFTWTWILAALSLFAALLYEHGNYDWEIRGVRIVGMALAITGVAGGLAAFARGGLRPVDRWVLAVALVMCVLSAAYLQMMGGIVKN